jgi:hypothetical protein
MESVNFDKLIGYKGNLYTTLEINTFQIGSVKFEVIEDESDGYRSLMQEVKILTRNNPAYEPIAEIEIKDCEIGYQLVDVEDGHVWLEFGTKNYDEYYPCFVFDWRPRPSIEDELKSLFKN